MANIISRPRGTLDLFYDDCKLMEIIKSKLIFETSKYGFTYVDIPCFEESKLFHRGVGESSDIVRKETFDLISKGDKEYTLRPEFTASINRAVIENKFYALPSLPLRYSYFGKAFRYERPQVGRYREFHQFGVEVLDTKIDIDSTIDTLLLAINSAKTILGNIDIKLRINFLGSLSSRESYKKALYLFFKDKISNMCEDCKRRLETNPLRILDCKVKEDQEIIKSSPKITNYLNKEDQEEYEKIKSYLTSLNIQFVEDDNLVRGLDYYTGLVFELYSESDVGAIGGGGKYSSLMKDIGGPEFEGIGFSFGVERLVLSLDDDRKKNLLSKVDDSLDYFIINLNKDFTSLKIASILREKGCKVTIPSANRSLNGALKMADRMKAKKVLIIENDVCKIKDMETRNQEEIKLSDLILKLEKGGNI